MAGCLGCATVTRGPSEVLEVKSTPKNADVTVYRYSKATFEKLRTTGAMAKEDAKDKWMETDVTPAAFKIWRNQSYIVLITAKGYKPSVVRVFNKPSGAGALGVAGNVIIGGLVGLGVDAISGSANELKPNPVTVTLAPGYSKTPIATSGEPPKPVTKKTSQSTSFDD